MNKHWRTPESIQAKKHRQKKLIYIIITVIPILLGTIVTLLVNKGI